MALIKCDECGREISSKSLFCPNCGHPTHLNAAHPDGREPEAFKAIRQAIAGTETPEETTAPSPEKEVAPQPPASQPAENIPETEPVTEEPADEAPRALDEYEQTLEGGAESRRRNERTKVFVFLGVFIALLGVVLYFYFTSPVEKIGEEAAEEEIDADSRDTLVQPVTPLPVDSVVNPVAEKTYSSTTDTAAVISRPANPAGRQSAPAVRETPAPADNQEIKVAPLSQQASHTTSSSTTSDTPSQP